MVIVCNILREPFSSETHIYESPRDECCLYIKSILWIKFKFVSLCRNEVEIWESSQRVWKNEERKRKTEDWAEGFGLCKYMFNKLVIKCICIIHVHV